MDADSLQQLLTMQMPFGKHKGCLLADLPGNYLNWFAREGFPSGELGRLLALMHEIDHNGLKPLLDPLRNCSPRVTVVPAEAGTQGIRSPERPGFPPSRE